MTLTSRSIGRIPTTLALLVIALSPPPHAAAQTDLVAQGRQALTADRVDDAVAAFEKAVATDPTNAAALVWLGSAQVRKARTAPFTEAAGWVEKGFTTMDDAVARFPGAYIVYVVRGVTAARVPGMFGKTPVAVSDLSAVVRMKEQQPTAVPDDVMPTVYLHLGQAYAKTGQRSEARAIWEKAKTLYPAAPERQAIEHELGQL